MLYVNTLKYDFIQMVYQYRQRKLKFSAFNGELFMAGSRGSAYTKAEQSLAQSRTQCTGRELLTIHFSLCARIFKTIILFCSPCQGVIPKGHTKKQTRKKIRRRTDTPTSFPVSILSVQFSESHLQASCPMCHMPQTLLFPLLQQILQKSLCVQLQ